MDTQKLPNPSVRIPVNIALVAHCGPDSDRLLTVLHDQGLCASKLGCGTGHCGACTVWVDGLPRRSCEITVESLVSGEGTASKRVTTLEGLVQENPRLADCLTQAFLAEQAAQCGYCTAGILMTAAALVRDHADKMIEQETTQSPSPVLTLSDVTRALDDHLCRCGSHRRVMRAVMLASELYLKQVHTQPLATSSGLRV